VAVDGVLGIGAAGAPRGAAAEAIRALAAYRARGARTVALDLPSGVDATTGASPGEAVVADVTVTFGSVKRGLLVARAHAGRIVVVDVGFLPPRGAAPRLVTGAWVREHLPPIAFDAHKGVRRHVLVVGGAPGMAGAAALATRAALASGAGIVKVAAAPESVAAVQLLVPEALAAAWPADGAAAAALAHPWPHVLVLGPGLGAGARPLLERLLAVWRGPVVLDADALNAFAGDAGALRELLGGRPALLTPHVAEFARLAGGTPQDALDERFDAGARLAAAVGATVLLKGVPTVVSVPDGGRLVTATGTAALGTGGSGDLLAGIAATLLAQTGDPLRAGAAAAWVHGRAAELATRGRPVRAVTLARVLAALPEAWRVPAPRPRAPVLAELTAPTPAR
jgi:NAD(P)H-hydrate epimerase